MFPVHMQYASRAQTQLAPLHAGDNLMGLDPTLKTQLHLRQAFPVILSKRWSGMLNPLAKQRLSKTESGAVMPFIAHLL